MALEAARLAPPDLYRQLRRNRASYLVGVDEPSKAHNGAHRHFESGGTLDAELIRVIDEAVLAIQLHRPFNEISYRLGLVAYYLAEANDPLATAGSDPQEGRYRQDFHRYFDSTDDRVRVVFYGFDAQHLADHPRRLLARTLDRGRKLYPLLGREYRRIGFRSGVGGFDDLSTAFAVASLSRSHAVSDIAEALRYIWITAGGIDSRPRLPLRGRHRIHLPREVAP